MSPKTFDFNTHFKWNSHIFDNYKTVNYIKQLLNLDQWDKRDCGKINPPQYTWPCVIYY